VLLTGDQLIAIALGYIRAQEDLLETQAFFPHGRPHIGGKGIVLLQDLLRIVLKICIQMLRFCLFQNIGQGVGRFFH